MSSPAATLHSPPSRVSRSRAPRGQKLPVSAAPAGPLAAFLLGAALALLFAVATHGAPIPL